MEDGIDLLSTKTLSRLPRRPPVDIEFHDLSFTVPQGRKGTKLILRNVNGQFRSGQLTAILGPSGAGKSTLLNILAGYKLTGAAGSVLINGEERNIKKFHKLSRYIMQQDLVQPLLTVHEVMTVAANLKLNKEITCEEKEAAIDEILDLLRLTGTKTTRTDRLSGGERKRVVIALELLNNPPVIFLDEPTTGLDDLSCSQCVMLLKLLANGGRTVICSIHTPSAGLFNIFDNVYCVNNGQCVYQGYGPSVLPFLESIGLVCPTTYNPADFLIEVCCGEYGDFQDKMVSAIENGHISHGRKRIEKVIELTLETDNQIQVVNKRCNVNAGDNPARRSTTHQFNILLMRMWLQMWRDKGALLLKIVLHILLGFLVGSIYVGMGQDGSKTIFNFGFYFTCIIFFMYVPMMPVLLQFPTEVQLLKREHFNRWYGLGSYFMALTCSTIPVQFVLGFVYLGLVYLISDQPLELYRWTMFYIVCMLTGIISESLGLLVATNLNILNAMFVGPVVTVPLMLLAVYGFGSAETIPFLIRISMYFSYLRYSMEGLINTMLRDRPNLPCPENEEFCIFTDLNYFIRVMGMEDTIFWVDICALVVCFLVFRGAGYYLLRQRLTPNKTFLAIQYIGRFVKSHFGIAR